MGRRRHPSRRALRGLSWWPKAQAGAAAPRCALPGGSKRTNAVDTAWQVAGGRGASHSAPAARHVPPRRAGRDRRRHVLPCAPPPAAAAPLQAKAQCPKDTHRATACARCAGRAARGGGAGREHAAAEDAILLARRPAAPIVLAAAREQRAARSAQRSRHSAARDGFSQCFFFGGGSRARAAPRGARARAAARRAAPTTAPRARTPARSALPFPSAPPRTCWWGASRAPTVAPPARARAPARAPTLAHRAAAPARDSIPPFDSTHQQAFIIHAIPCRSYRETHVLFDVRAISTSRRFGFFFFFTPLAAPCSFVCSCF